ncbi:MAG: threonine--tRNA ligase [Anaerolineae bacterium]|uniref:threonine--tRNA ligase n=1 Tax=Promineifilum sp. TaxID=2664178 RepID=UPI001DE9913F|nr:threonine--tRNA ligase [Anaerolineales bacterium]MCB8936031.1 threonine--tRNA ligase [Promineifilum sp.]MCO5181911.1 threonine--tRNA ligase [Promineifilum sp.]MCW5846408.1 threonine--tRNA ligase [Anaerolineae bacterium]
MADNGNVPYIESDLYRIRHSAAHVMAEAVVDLFPEVRLAIGPPVEDGFYYDFDLGLDERGKPRTFTPEDLERIEARMQELLRENAAFEHTTLPVGEALDFFAGQPYKVELIEALAAGKVDENGEPTTEPAVEVGLYRQREFVDLCRGPHVGRTRDIKANAVKLLRTSGAYWRGDEHNPQLQRIYGTAWHNKAELDEYLQRLEEAKLRDHRRLGKQLGLFHISPLVGSGLPLWLPKGAVLRETLENFLRQAQLERGYLPVITPHIGNLELYRKSGHYPYYKDSQYTPIKVDEEEFLLKPMNCPHHIEIYRSEPRSYRDLPYRLAEFGTVYRYEKSGELTGLTRVRGFTVDDSHLFVAPEQLEEEFIAVVDLIQYVFGTIGFSDFRARLGINDPASDKYAGEPEMWARGIAAIRNAADKLGLNYTIEEGEAAFYGPKLDFIFRDVLKREWQLGTVQVDFLLPERFDLEYTGEDGQKHRPVMIHRAPFGSMERFVGILIEHFNGAFPLWLSPVQATVIPIADRHVAYAQAVAADLKAAGIRVTVDDSSERMNKKIRAAQLQKTPYMLVVGDKEEEAGAVAVRTRDNDDRGAQPLATFLRDVSGLIAARSLEL